MKHVNLSIYDYAGKKLADLYDSSINTPGQASNIVIKTQLNGWKTLTFSLPFLVNGEDNWRWNHIKAEYKVRVIDGEDEDWFIVTAPKFSKKSKKIDGTIECGHASAILKTKNLYLTFDETNGIGTLPYLMKQILAGTGWSFDEEDYNSHRIYENYAVDSSGTLIERVRSLKSESKDGAYALIGTVCDLFGAYPIYDTVRKSVRCRALKDKEPLWEMEIGKNLDALSVEYDSDSIITRLYVEGDYEQDEYVGIDDVNPTGLSYLLNFDYYKSINAFTPAHEAALDLYLGAASSLAKDIRENGASLLKYQSALSTLWGNANYVLWTVVNGEPDRKIVGGTVTLGEEEFVNGDTIYVFEDNGEDGIHYTTRRFTAGMTMRFDENVVYVMKFIGTWGGSIAAKEVAIEAKEQHIDDLRKEIQKELDKPEGERNQSLINKDNDMIEKDLQAIESVRLGQSETETHEYSIKVPSVITLNGNENTAQVNISRLSKSTILSTAAYELITDEVDLTSDESITTYRNAKIKFGPFGTSSVIPVNTELHALDGAKMVLDSDEILNVGFVHAPITLSVEAEDGTADILQLSGTEFKFSIEARAYGIYEQFAIAVSYAVMVDDLTNVQNEFLYRQRMNEADFVIAMGDLLRDGYWNDPNYVSGQEIYLYNDALDVMKELSKPTVKYTVSLFNLSEEMGVAPRDVKLNSLVRVYDPDLNINDIVYVKTITRTLDNPAKDGAVEISNEEVDISASLDSIFSRIASIADIVEQRRNIYERAKTLTEKGSLGTERLEGAIDLLSTRLSSAVSNWYTDDNGNIIFESVDGRYAMMLCGEGFLIANGKKDNGTWNWRTKHHWFWLL